LLDLRGAAGEWPTEACGCEAKAGSSHDGEWKKQFASAQQSGFLCVPVHVSMCKPVMAMQFPVEQAEHRSEARTD